MKNHLTEKLLTAWREAERAADAAHALAEQARLTADAASAAADAAREAAEGAGVNVARADIAGSNPASSHASLTSASRTAIQYVPASSTAPKASS